MKLNFLALLIAIFLHIAPAAQTLESWNWLQAAGEALGAFVLMFSISSVAIGKAEKNASGIVIGFGLLVGLIISYSTGALAILNPAIAIALGASSLTYFIAPMAGTILGIWTYKALSK